jgi:tetratricopeptide (TPR) repeat protein
MLLFEFIVATIVWLVSFFSTPQPNGCTNQGGMAPEIRVANCTGLINSGRYGERDLVFLLNSRGIAYADLRDFDSAFRDYDQAIAINPKFALGFNNRCYTGAIKGKLQEAMADCNEALRLTPDEPMFLDSRGFVYLKLGEFDTAIADFDAAIKLDPRHAHSLYGRGIAKRKKGDVADGNSDIDAAKALQAGIAEEFAGYGVN